MSVLWTSADASAATGGETTRDWAATGVSIDTRELAAGDLFVALKDVRDGHDFVAAALEKGAAAALVTHRPEGVAEDAPLLIVPDVLGALEDLGRAARARTQAKVIGVTGSVGKTGTKEMLRTALERQGKTHAAIRSFNNHWGVPLTLARMPADTEYAVIEIGMNHAGEITPLAKMADLDVAIVTIVAEVHLEAFDDIYGIAHAKAEIFAGLRKGGVAVINADTIGNDILKEAAKAAGGQIIEFGTADHATFHLTSADVKGEATFVSVTLNSKEALFKIAAPGAHLAMNALAVLGAVEAVGADIAQATLALGGFEAPDGRGARQEIFIDQERTQTITLIDESFNANPTSMAAALNVLATTDAAGRKIVVLGDMLELGPSEAEMHQGLGTLAGLAAADQVYCVGPLMQNLHRTLPTEQDAGWFEDATSLADILPSKLLAGDVVMVKGSKGSYVSRVARAIEELNVE